MLVLQNCYCVISPNFIKRQAGSTIGTNSMNDVPTHPLSDCEPRTKTDIEQTGENKNIPLTEYNRDCFSHSVLSRGTCG